MLIICKNCRKTFNAKNALFCSTSCYKFYTDAITQSPVSSLNENTIQNNGLVEPIVLKYDTTRCNHEYSKNGTISCRKCGNVSFHS